MKNRHPNRLIESVVTEKFHFYKTGLCFAYPTHFGALCIPPAKSQAKNHCQSSRSGYHLKGAFASSVFQ